MKFITLYVKLVDPKGKPVTGQITIKKGYAMAIFSDKALAKALYNKDLEQGKDVAYNAKYNAYIQRFKGYTLSMVKDKILKEIKKAGGKEIINPKDK